MIMKTILILLVLINITVCISAQDAAINKNRSYITAQEFVKQNLEHANSAKFNDNVVHEVLGNGKAIVLGKVVVNNAFGIPKEYSYKIWLLHNGKDWTSLSNWKMEKLILEDINTKQQQIIDNRIKPQNNKEKKELSLFNGIKASIIESNESMTRITTSKKMTESQIKQAVLTWKIQTNIIYFHLPNKASRGQEYAMKNKDLILIY